MLNMSPTTCVSVCVCAKEEIPSKTRCRNVIRTYDAFVDVMWENHFDFGICDQIEYIIPILNQHRDMVFRWSCKLQKAKKKSRTTSTSTLFRHANIQLWQKCLITLIEVISKECCAKSSRNKRHSACALSHWTIRKWLNYRLANPKNDNLCRRRWQIDAIKDSPTHLDRVVLCRLSLHFAFARSVWTMVCVFAVYCVSSSPLLLIQLVLIAVCQKHIY